MVRQSWKGDLPPQPLTLDVAVFDTAYCLWGVLTVGTGEPAALLLPIATVILYTPLLVYGDDV